eukprot:6606690-Pyramimonas_sp.AAC.1
MRCQYIPCVAMLLQWPNALLQCCAMPILFGVAAQMLCYEMVCCATLCYGNWRTPFHDPVHCQ